MAPAGPSTAAESDAYSFDRFAFAFERLSGSEEVPGPGDPDGRGFGYAFIDTEAGTLCYGLLALRIQPATMAHIHEGPDGGTGPVVVNFEPPTDGFSSGCLDIGTELAGEIAAEPSDYYFNVHNAEYPAGALRGQLD